MQQPILSKVRDDIELRGYSDDTLEMYTRVCRDYLGFLGDARLEDTGEAEVRAWSFEFRLVPQPYPLRPPDAVRVSRAEVSPPASFGFRLTTDTLAIGYALPAAGRAGDFHPLGVCHARHTEKSLFA